MIGRLWAFLAALRQERRIHRKRRRAFEKWRTANPGGTYGQFYAMGERRDIDGGRRHRTLGITSVDQEEARRRGQAILKDLTVAGCRPDHVVVDYGCGSLWIGEALMGYLNPDCYIGLDVSDAFYAEGLTRIPALVSERRPTLAIIDERSLAEVRRRRPDFIFALHVVQHVPPADLAGFLASIVSLAGLHTRIDITHPAGWRTAPVGRRHWRHGRRAIDKALRPLGCVADYRQDQRIIASKPGFTILRRSKSG